MVLHTPKIVYFTGDLPFEIKELDRRMESELIFSCRVVKFNFMWLLIKSCDLHWRLKSGKSSVTAYSSFLTLAIIIRLEIIDGSGKCGAKGYCRMEIKRILF